MKSSAEKITLTGYDDLFQTGGKSEVNGEQIQEVPLSELFPFKDHPFQVRDDEAMQKTVESITRNGVLSPGIVRHRPEGGYEIIAGHRRKRGSELAGRETMPVIIRELDDQVVLKQARLRQYFPQTYTAQQMEEVIVSLLETWSVQQR